MNFSDAQSGWPPRDDANSPVVAFHLMGVVPYETMAALERRLMEDVLARGEPRIVVILYEPTPSITVGRRGSRIHIRLTSEELRERRLSVRWVNRGGGCWLHGPGQLAMHAVAPIALLGWKLADIRRRLHDALVRTLTDLKFHVTSEGSPACIHGRTGILATLGVGQRDGVSHHGGVLNVNPAMAGFESVDVIDPKEVVPNQKTTLSSLFAEHRQPVKMTGIRAALVQNLAEAFGSETYHLYTGHPWVRRISDCRSRNVD